jgi:hypothetical protein
MTDKADDLNALYIVDRQMYPYFPGTQVDSIILERSQVHSYNENKLDEYFASRDQTSNMGEDAH